MDSTFCSILSCPINTKIRVANLSDAAVIADYNARLAHETEGRQLDLAILTAGVTTLLKDASKGLYFLAETADAPPRIAGQLMITYEWSDWRNGTFWWIQSVYVAEPFRRSGIFKTLFQHVHDLCQNRKDVCGLRLYVDADNARAQQVYKRMGLNPTEYLMFEQDRVLKR